MSEGITFKSTDHQQRFFDAMQQIEKIDSGRLDPEYGAAIYVLTADLATWYKAQGYIKRDGILFEEMLQNQDWSGGYRVLIQWAANLFNEHAASCNPVELMRLDESNFEVALAALKIRRYSWRVKGQQ
ncbi:MAG: hypothetical protein J2P37_00330 [Ktedonobacteraceae bacterium]|nr:hypothetical protein [Ktedonobacteraceae bacterium]